MRIRHTPAAVAVAAAAVMVGGAVAAPAAQAAPVTQIPAIGVQISGLVIPGPLLVTAHATPKAGDWQTEFSAYADPAACSSSAAGMLVRIDYVNPGAARTGSVLVKPCRNFLNPTPTHVKADTGPGQVFTVTSIVGSSYQPRAGQPSLPGLGTFTR